MYLLIVLDKGTKFYDTQEDGMYNLSFFFFCKLEVILSTLSCLIYKAILKFHFPISLPKGNFQLSLTPIH